MNPNPFIFTIRPAKNSVHFTTNHIFLLSKLSPPFCFKSNISPIKSFNYLNSNQIKIMSLVADYTDSDEEIQKDIEPSSSIIEESTNSKPSKFITNPLLSSGNQQEEDSSEDSSTDSDQDEEEESKKKKAQPPDIILDNPFRYFGAGEVSAEDSVLRVEFREQAAHKTAVMEHHVKMTETVETAGAALKINGKSICWQHRKGKCRFGHTCKFAHMSDILQTNVDGTTGHTKMFDPIKVAGTYPIVTNPFKDKEEDIPQQPVVFSSGAHLSGEDKHAKRKKCAGDISDEEDDSKMTGKKKRPGLSSNLVPGKKVMNMYYKSNKP